MWTRRSTRLVAFGPGLVLALIVGFLLGSCGGGDGGALATQTGLTGTRPALTATRPATTAEPTVPTRTFVPTRTETSEGETTTTEPPVTIETTVETQTTVSVPIVPTTTTADTTTAAAAEPTSSTNETPWGWIALGVALGAALLIGLLLWRRQRSQAASWSTRLADLSRRCLVALDDVMAQGSIVTGQIEALAAETRSLEARAPDDASRASVARLRARLDELANTLESDRALRLSSPPPSAEQLSYSTALIRQQAEQLRSVLRTPSDQPRPPG
jgi:hypothetical protein